MTVTKGIGDSGASQTTQPQVGLSPFGLISREAAGAFSKALETADARNLEAAILQLWSAADRFAEPTLGNELRFELLRRRFGIAVNSASDEVRLWAEASNAVDKYLVSARQFLTAVHGCADLDSNAREALDRQVAEVRTAADQCRLALLKPNSPSAWSVQFLTEVRDQLRGGSDLDAYIRAADIALRGEATLRNELRNGQGHHRAGTALL